MKIGLFDSLVRPTNAKTNRPFYTDMNPIVLALIGLPLVLGVYLRFRRFNAEILIINVQVTSLVMLTVGIGYSFMTFYSPKDTLINPHFLR